jgi:hypothetical protein
MAKRTDVVRPSWAWFVLLDGGILALSVFSASAEAHSAVSDATPVPLPSRRTCQQMLVATAVIHVTEAMTAGRMARRRGLSPRGWRGQTLLVGFPSLLALRRVETTSSGGAAVGPGSKRRGR